MVARLIRQILRGIRLSGIILYVFVSRILVFLLALWTIFYFSITSITVTREISRLISSIIPGTIDIGSIRPRMNPLNIDVWDVFIKKPDGMTIIKVPHVRVKMAILPFIGFALRLQKSLYLNFKKVDVYQPYVLLPFDKTNRFTFTDAFAPPVPKSHKKHKKTHHIILNFKKITLHDGQVQLSFPWWDLKLNKINSSNITLFMNIADIEKSMFIHGTDLRIDSGKSLLRLPALGNKLQFLPISALSLDYFMMDGLKSLSFYKARLFVPGIQAEASGKMYLPEKNKDVPLKYNGSVIMHISNEMYLSSITRGFVKGTADIVLSGAGSIKNPEIAAHVTSKGIQIKNIRDIFSTVISLNGTQTKKGYEFHVSKVTLKSKSEKIIGKNIRLYPLKGSPWAFSGRIKFINLKNPFASKIPKLLGIPERFNGELVWKTGKYIHVNLKSTARVKNYGLFNPTRLIIRLNSSITRDFSKITLNLLSIKQNAYHLDLKGRFLTDSLGIYGIANLKWPIDPMMKRLGLKISGDVIADHIKIHGRVVKPVIEGDVKITNANFENIQKMGITANCKINTNSAICSRFKIRGKDTMLIGNGLSLVHNWTRLNLKKLAGVTELSLFRKEIKGHLRIGLTNFAFDIRHLKPLKGNLFVSSSAIRTKMLKFGSVILKVKANKGRLFISRLNIKFASGMIIAGGMVLPLKKQIQMHIWTKVKDLNLNTLKDIIPAQGILNTSIKADFVNNSWSIFGKLTGSDLKVSNIIVGDVTLNMATQKKDFINLWGGLSEGTIKIGAGSGLAIRGFKPELIKLNFIFNKLRLNGLLPKYIPSQMQVTVTGIGMVRYKFKNMELRTSLNIPDKGLDIFVIPSQRHIKSNGFNISFVRNILKIQGLKLIDGQRTLNISARLNTKDNKGVFKLKGQLGFHLFRLISPQILTAEGGIKISLEGGWDAQNYNAFGIIQTHKSFFQIEGLVDPVTLMPDSKIVFQSINNKTFIKISEGYRLKAKVGEGLVSIWGQLSSANRKIQSMTLHLDGVNLRIEKKGEFWMKLNPQLDYTQIQGQKQLSGVLKITQGAYIKDYSKIIGVSSESKEINLRGYFNYFRNTRLNINVLAKNFKLKSKVPLGSTDITANANLNIRGTLSSPLLYQRVDVIPGSTIFYKLVTRRFKVKRGTILFDGDPLHPDIDLLAQTSIEYKSKRNTTNIIQSRFIEEALEDTTGFSENTILVNLRIKGRFPDIGITLSSSARDLDQVDLEYLLLTGMTRKDFGASGARINIGMLTEGLSGILAKLLMSPVIDVASIGIEPTGGISADVSLKFGKNVSLMTSVERSPTFARYYAGFKFMLMEHLYLEGLVRSVQMSLDPTEIGHRYETKLHWRIPLQ